MNDLFRLTLADWLILLIGAGVVLDIAVMAVFGLVLASAKRQIASLERENRILRRLMAAEES